MSRTIQFSVSVEQREEIDAYALAKGFHTAANLARFAVVQYMSRYPLKPTDGSKDKGGASTSPDKAQR